MRPERNATFGGTALRLYQHLPLDEGYLPPTYEIILDKLFWTNTYYYSSHYCSYFECLSQRVMGKRPSLCKGSYVLGAKQGQCQPTSMRPRTHFLIYLITCEAIVQAACLESETRLFGKLVKDSLQDRQQESTASIQTALASKRRHRDKIEQGLLMQHAQVLGTGPVTLWQASHGHSGVQRLTSLSLRADGPFSGRVAYCLNDHDKSLNASISASLASQHSCSLSGTTPERWPCQVSIANTTACLGLHLRNWIVYQQRSVDEWQRGHDSARHNKLYSPVLRLVVPAAGKAARFEVQ